MDHEPAIPETSARPDAEVSAGRSETPSVQSDTIEPPAEARSGLTRRDLMLGAVGVVVTGAITLGMLNARTTPAAAAPGTSVQSALKDPPGAIRTANPKWQANRAAWLGGGRKGAAYEVVAESDVAVWMRNVRPKLVVRCLGKSADVFVFTQSASAIEPRTEDHTVRFAFDDQAETTQRWPDSAEHDALFTPDGRAFTERLMHASTLRFTFTPHNAPAVTAHFTVAGLQPLLAHSAKDCGSFK